MPQQFHYGGQAVIEGVMIRGKTHLTVAVRQSNGEVLTRCESLPSLSVSRLRRVPLVRGVLVLLEALILGTRALMFSARAALEEAGKERQELPWGATWGLLTISMALGIGLFFVVPLLAVRALDPHLTSSILSNVVEGAVRLAIFLGYLYAMGFLPEMRRVFAYHGAEHMTIAAHEEGASLTVSEVKRFPRQHPRCGTSFLLLVMVVAVLVFAFLGRPPLGLRILSRVAMLPAIAAISYELIRLTAAHHKSILARWTFVPGLALQALTTRIPTEGQIEVAITALHTALAADTEEERKAGTPEAAS